MKLRHLVCVSIVLVSAAVAQSNPVPFISQPLAPMTSAPGGLGFTLTVNGTGFISSSVVNWNETPLTTTFVSSSQLTATVLAANVATADTAVVTVSNPGPGGGLSNPQFFQVATAAASLIFTSLVPFGLAEDSSPTSFTTGDFNGDGKLDLAGSFDSYPSTGTFTVCVLLGNGDGTFQTPACLNPSSAALVIPVAADFNGDGKLDLALADNLNNRVGVFLGNGDGTLQSPKFFATGTGPQSMVSGDFNGDGKLDLAVANFDGTLTVVLGNGDGTFQSPIGNQTGTEVTVGDFNGDGILDLATLSPANVLLGNGDGTFVSTALGVLAGYSIATADVNGDGKADLVSTVCSDPTCLQNVNFVVLLGNGDGSFQSPIVFGTTYPFNGNAAIAGFADVNADGKLDVLTTITEANGTMTDIFLGNGDGTFQAPITPGGQLAADFNNDGRVDLLISNPAPPTTLEGTLQVFLQGSFPVATSIPAFLDFDTPTGQSSMPDTSTIMNTGLATLTLSKIAITGANAGDFSQSNTCGSTLAVNASCQISVTFTPTAVGIRSAAITINDNAPGSSQSVLTLTGSGIAPDFSVTAIAPTSQTVTPGQAANYSVSIAPVNGFSQMLTLSCSGAPAQSTCKVTPASVTLDGNQPVTATIAVVTSNGSMGFAPTIQRPSNTQLALWMGLPGLYGVVMLGNFGFRRRRRFHILRTLGILWVISMGVAWSGCGGNSGGSGGGGSGTPAGTYNLLVTGSYSSGSTNVSHSANLTLVVQ